MELAAEGMEEESINFMIETLDKSVGGDDPAVVVKIAHSLSGQAQPPVLSHREMDIAKDLLRLAPGSNSFFALGRTIHASMGDQELAMTRVWFSHLFPPTR